MSFIKLNIVTNKETNSISVKSKGQCSLDELQAATAYFMASLASNTSVKVVEDLMEGLKNDRATDTEEDT